MGMAKADGQELLVDCMAVVKEFNQGKMMARRPGLLYAGHWRRAAWDRMSKIWKVAAHQEVKEDPPRPRTRV